MDVFAQEPPMEYRLVKHDHVIATSHIGAFTAESVQQATAQAVDSLLAVLREIK